MTRSVLPFYLAITIALAACNDAPTANGTNGGTEQQTTPAAPVAIRGQEAFQQKCSSCHGKDGTAGVGGAPNLQLSKLDSAAIFKTISEGRGMMPAFASQLTTEEIADLSSYLLALRGGM